MKRLLLSCTLLFPVIANAQGFNGDTGCDCFSGKKGSGKIPVYLGLNAGYFYQTYDKDVTINNSIGAPYGGLLFGVHAAPYLSIQTGINYTYSANLNNNLSGFAPPTVNEGNTISVHYLEIPLEVQLRLIVYRNWTIYLQPGIYNNLIMQTDVQTPVENKSSFGIDYNHMYAGGGLGVGYIINRKWMVFATGEYHTMLMEGNYAVPDFKNRMGGRLGLTYTFRSSKK